MALATVQIILFVLVFARTLTFDFAMVSQFILSMGLSMQKVAATSKTIDIDTTTSFVSHMSD